MKSQDRDKAEQALLIARANAIQEYALVEQELCRLCGRLLNTPPDLAGIVFFKITSSRARNAAVEGLLRKRFEATYNLYRNSMIKLIGKTDQRRNEIVHWQTYHQIERTPDGMVHEFSLTPPNIWDLKPSTPFITVRQLRDFIDQCDFIVRSIGLLIMIAVDGHQHPSHDAWHEIFQQPLAYPPPDTHPLFRKPAAP